MFVDILNINGEMVCGKGQRTPYQVWGAEKAERFWDEKFWNVTLTVTQAKELLKKYGYDMFEKEDEERKYRESYANIKLCECSIWKCVDTRKRIPRTEFEGETVYFSVNGTTSQAKVKNHIAKSKEKGEVMDIDKKKFAKAMEENHEELHILKLLYLNSQLKEAEVKELFADVYKTVLQEHEYCAATDGERIGLKVGDRITTDSEAFLMSENDFEKYLAHAQKLAFERGYVTEDGTFKEGYNGSEIRRIAENNLIDFFLSILPQKLQEAFATVHKSVTHKQKLLNVIMGANEESAPKEVKRELAPIQEQEGIKILSSAERFDGVLQLIHHTFHSKMFTVDYNSPSVGVTMLLVDNEPQARNAMRKLCSMSDSELKQYIYGEKTLTVDKPKPTKKAGTKGRRKPPQK